jgi:hypothetical protein
MAAPCDGNGECSPSGGFQNSPGIHLARVSKSDQNCDEYLHARIGLRLDGHALNEQPPNAETRDSQSMRYTMILVREMRKRQCPEMKSKTPCSSMHPVFLLPRRGPRAPDVLPDYDSENGPDNSGHSNKSSFQREQHSRRSRTVHAGRNHALLMDSGSRASTLSLIWKDLFLRVSALLATLCLLVR